MDILIEKIEQWAQARNLIDGAAPQAQMLKMTEEVGELAHAIARSNIELAKDAIGDCIVVLTILSRQLGLNINECVESAYTEIKDRKGKMINGVFIKEE